MHALRQSLLFLSSFLVAIIAGAVGRPLHAGSIEAPGLYLHVAIIVLALIVMAACQLRATEGQPMWYQFILWLVSLAIATFVGLYTLLHW